MKRRLFTLSVAAICGLPALAQHQWTMDDCVFYAVEHSTEVRKQQIETDRRKSDYRYAVLDFLPTVQASVSGQYSWGRNIDPETNTYNNVTTFNNYYQLYASLPIFDGGRTLNAFRQARLARQNSASALQKVREDKAIDVMGKFVDALYAAQSIRLAAEKLADSRSLLHKTQRLFELGEKSRPDVAQIESQVAEDDYNLLHQQNTARQTLLALKSAMNFPVADTLWLDTTLVATVVSDAPIAETVSGFEAASPEVKNAEYAKQTAKLDWRKQQSYLWPTLSLGAGVATNYYKNLSQKGGYASFGSQFHNNLGEYVYLTLSIPLFVPSYIKNAKSAKASYLVAAIDLEEVKRKLNDNITQAILDRDGYVKEVMQMERKVAADSAAYRMNRRKFDEGMLSVFDLHTSSQSLLESRIKLLQTQMMLVLKEKLVKYYKGTPLWTSK